MLSEAELLWRSLLIFLKRGGFPYLNKGFVLDPPVCLSVVSAAVFITELAGVLCVVLVSLLYLLELAGVLCVVPYYLCCLEHARVPCVVRVCCWLLLSGNSPGYLV